MSSADSVRNLMPELIRRYDIDMGAAQLLALYRFDVELFETLRRRLAAPANRAEGPSPNTVRGAIEPPREGDLVPLAPSGSAERERLAAIGTEALAQGQVGVLLLAGGMATRFGGSVKALAQFAEPMTFIEAKQADLHRLSAEVGRPVPLWLMASFQTFGQLTRWAAQASTDTVPIGVVPQGISMRLTPEGDLWRDGTGHVSLHAPGHGDAPSAMQSAGVLGEFAAGGGRYLALSNVDNLAATVDPAVVGAHIDRGGLLTCEVTPTQAPGGAPWRLDGRLQIVESFRLPAEIDPTAAGATNTNSLVADIGVFEGDWPLSWFEVRKQVNGAEVIQFERLIGELSAFVETTMLLVPSSGVDGRFQPVKDVAELEARRPEILRILAARGIAAPEAAP